MNPDVLAGLLRRVYASFDMSTFDNRLKVQKFVYLLQEYGLNLGYRFSLYLRGPYCTEVANDGFQIENFQSAPQMKFANAGAEKRFEDFRAFYAPHKDDPEWLEIAASILIFRRLYGPRDFEEISQMVLHKSPFFRPSTDRIRAVWDELVTGGLMNGG